MKLPFFKNMAIGILMVASCAIGVVNATLITDLSARDWQTVGDNGLTYDRSTGLEWLDLSYTLGNSMVTTNAELLSLYSGFRWATHIEVDNLISSVLLGVGERKTYDSVTDINKASTFLDLLGSVQDANPNVVQPSRWSLGVSEGSLNPNTHPIYLSYGLHMVQLTTLDDYYADSHLGDTRVRVKGEFSHCCFVPTQSSYNVGSWLVRTAQVPEPSTFAIFALGILGLAASRFKKQA